MASLLMCYGYELICMCSLTDITRSRLEVSSLSQFWGLWNDCPCSTGNAYLLTTLSELVLHTTGFPVVQIQQHSSLHAHSPPPSLHVHMSPHRGMQCIKSHNTRALTNIRHTRLVTCPCTLLTQSLATVDRSYIALHTVLQNSQ